MIDLESGPEGWWHLAACRDEDPELFFPIGAGEATAHQVAAAKQVCARCPVRAACREYALAQPELTGVWGGMSEEERRAEPAGTVASRPSRHIEEAPCPSQHEPPRRPGRVRWPAGAGP